MNQQLIGLARTIFRFALTVAPSVLLLYPTLECRTQSLGIPSAISSLQAKQITITELEWQLMNLNVRRAYEKHDDYSAAPIVYENRLQRFSTRFLVPANSSLLRSTARTQMDAFEVEINGLRLELIAMLGLSDSFFDKIAAYIEADFVTYEAPNFFVIGRFRESKIQLVREKLKLSR